MSYPWDWTPKRGDATHSLGQMFDAFYDANRLGFADGEDVAAIVPPLEYLPDESGNNHHLWLGSGITPNSVQMNDPSDGFGTNNAGLLVSGQLGSIVCHENADTDVVQVSQAITPLLGRGAVAANDPQAVTLVIVGDFSSFLFPYLTPFTFGGAIDTGAHLFGKDTNWVTGSNDDPADSGIAVDNDPHLFIVESGTTTSGVEVDGVEGNRTDLSAAGITYPDSWAIVGAGEWLFLGVLAGLLSDGQKQLIRDWVNANVSTITVA